MQRQKGVMSIGLWEKCVDEIVHESPGTDCWFSACGEPLLEPDLLCQMISHGKARGLKSVNLNTNGMLMNAELCDRILGTGVDVVVFGVDGFSRGTYEGIRRGGDRNQVYSNIERFLLARQRRSKGPEIQVQFIEMDENEHELEAFTRHWLERGAVVKARRKLSWGGRVDTPFEIASGMRIPCPWAINLMDVFWDGRVPLCPGDVECSGCVGNAWDESLSELWRRLAPHRSLHLERRFDELPQRCQTCKDWTTGASEKRRPTGPSAEHRTGRHTG
jgi:MoaA/NifB/PqqE/SkfB family radical SAM enzyme